MPPHVHATVNPVLSVEELATVVILGFRPGLLAVDISLRREEHRCVIHVVRVIVSTLRDLVKLLLVVLFLIGEALAARESYFWQHSQTMPVIFLGIGESLQVLGTVMPTVSNLEVVHLFSI